MAVLLIWGEQVFIPCGGVSYEKNKKRKVRKHDMRNQLFNIRNSLARLHLGLPGVIYRRCAVGLASYMYNKL